MRERLRLPRIVPGHELSAHAQKRLEREAARMRLDRPLLVDQRLGVVAIHAHDSPVRLLSTEIFRITPGRRARGNVREEVVARGGPLHRNHRELANAVRARHARRRRNAQAQIARLHLGEIDPVAPAVPAVHCVHAVPLRAVAPMSRRRSSAPRRPVPSRWSRRRTRAWCRSRARSLRVAARVAPPRCVRLAIGAEGGAGCPAAADVALATGVPVYGCTGSSGVNVSASSHTVPLPPLPAVIEISIVARCASSPPPRGPHAKVMCRFLSVTVRHSSGKRTFTALFHHTLSPVESMSFTSKFSVGACAANAIRERVVLRQRDVELLARDRVAAMAVEVEVEPHRAAVHAAAVGRDHERHAVRWMRAPARGRLEAVEQPRGARERGRLRARGRGQRHRAQRHHASQAAGDSPLHAPGHHALDVVALQDQKDDHHGEHREHRSRHHELRVLHVLAHEARERDRQRVAPLVATAR